LPRFQKDLVHTHGFLYVLDQLLAKILVTKIELVPHLIVCHSGNADAARFSKTFKPRGYVHSVSEDFLVLFDNIANVNANTKLHSPVSGQFLVALLEPPLQRHRAFQGINHTGEFQEKSVSGSVDNPTSMISYKPEHYLPMGLQRADGLHLIPAHEAAVALYIRMKHCGELTSHCLSHHGNPRFGSYPLRFRSTVSEDNPSLYIITGTIRRYQIFASR